MYNVEYDRIVKSIENSYLPSQLENILNWVEHFEVLYGKEKAEELKELAEEKLYTFE
tara:strand:+ start:14034 stop:14204 length:171 start_codon:yes stop_codon:yes gene_type:complete